ncbi:zf-HC2 domain-containing protein [Aneurinibacillus uraniidurans]|uniref:zf-HC2 domain-containing protein n=1 Tax=Aneurinibacillus uraniidurans TaxID=2966586 RepID=UPI00234BB271|nr:zf-HC2 domain-containing protein [Aneurinibacillus sp. B1]WCN36902.1 anti-sigma factor [Aneurinibacillus sp. B1]
MEHMEDMLSAYLDHELSAEEYSAVEEHIEACEECRDLVDELSFIKQQTFDTYQFIAVPDSVTDKIMEAIRANTGVTENRNYAKLAAIFASVSVIFFTPILLYAGAIGSNLFSSFVAIVVVIWKTGMLVMSNTPSFVSGLAGFAIFLLLLSIWFLRKLLSVRIVGSENGVM